MDAVKAGASWRDSARAPKLFMFDAIAVFPLVILLFNISWWTFGIAISVMIFLKVLDYYGFKLPVFLRFVRAFIAGPRKIATPWWL